MIRRLRRKLVVITMTLSTALLVVICAVFVLSIREGLQRDSMSVLQRVIAETETPQWAGRSGVSLPYFTVTVTPNGGTSIISSQFYDLDDYDRLISAVDAALSQGRNAGELRQEELRYLRQATSEGWRMAFVDVSYERSTLKKAVVTVVLVGALALGVLFALSVTLARWAVRPVEQSVEQQRQFIADASHELKTPLTVILSNADLIARQEGLPDHIRRWTENIRTGGGQMQSLVEQMLTLERSESRQEGGESRTGEMIDLSDLTENALLLFEPVAYEAGKTLEEETISPGLTVQGDGASLSRALDILLDNAVKYTPAGGGIRVTLEEAGKNACFRVSNQGEPIPEEERERIFRRFYRSDAARSSEGFGLGLAIARSIAEEHGGTLNVTSHQGWNTFTLVIPLAN